MSGWLHPEGPEGAATYWWRRSVVIAAVVVLLVLAVSLIGRAAQGEEPQTATPAAGPTTEIGPGPEPTSTARTSTEPTSTARNSTTPTSAAPTSTATGPTSTASTGTSSTSEPPSAGRSDADPSTGTGKAPTKSSAEVCDASKLRLTLQGDPSPKVGAKVAFSLSLINGTGVSCAVTRNAETTVLKIYSGADRIWSTADCAAKVQTADTVLKPEQAASWKVVWDGSRSKSGCGTRPETPKPGTYFATFSYDGSKPVQQLMMLSAR